ncbi:hypothetical protein GMB86_01150 [Terrilactibacillus sp. BCM23-1]|uniref:DUF2933 domain-containing protein n=1 Tax=Terrilactibacillus tamarindi TaxID=2599694 RepID=A0A6N8CMC2_9BACI|nr:hypothetical protein [Terrilactibacillus tamarindi]MTT30620.1 hypothetical protein [Terrilactibacillus tamarindi]
MDLSWLTYLLCPLMMIPMMFMMMKGHHSNSNHSKQPHISDELNTLKEQNSHLQKEIQQLKNKVE